MSSAEFASHLKDEATKIKDLVAKLAADKVLTMANGQQQAVGIERTDRSQKAGHDVGLPADHGYSWLDSDSQAVIDEWKNKYKINLLTFDAADKEDAEKQLKDTHLTWIVTQFDRGGKLPYPKKAEGPIKTLSEIAGEGDLVEVEDKDDKTDFKKNVSAGESLLGNNAFGQVDNIQTSVAGWKAGTADAFKTKFLPRISLAVSNQITATKTLRNLLAAHQGMLTTARRNLDETVHGGLDAVEVFDECCGGGDPDIVAGLGVAAGVLTMVAGAIAIPVSGGTSGAIAAGGFTIAAGAATTLQSAESVKKPDHDLGADTVEETADNIKAAVTATYKDLDDAYDKLTGKGFSEVQGKLDEQKLAFCAPRPNAFADSTEGNVRDNTEED